MSKEIHEKDIGQEKQVFEVTLPKNQLEKIQICIGNAYDSPTADMVKYNIYLVDKTLKKVTECIGFYELPKNKNVLDRDKDFDVRGLGEDSMNIYEDVKQRFTKGLKKPVKPVSQSPPDSSSDEENGDESSSDEETENKDRDDISFIQDYFNGNSQLPKDKIVKTYLDNFAKGGIWASEIAIALTGLFSNVYIIIANERELYSKEKPSSKDTPLLDLNMRIYPEIELLPYDKNIEYVIISYEKERHYRVVQHAGKAKFTQEELPATIIERFCKLHHPSVELPKGVEDETFDTTVISTTGGGDCFFDSIYRATKSSDPSGKPPDIYLSEVHAFRKEIAKAMEKNQKAAEIITRAYIRSTRKSTDSIRDDFYKEKKMKVDDNIFQYAYTSIFSVNKYDEDDFTFEEKRHVLTNFLTLFYEFSPDTSEASKDKFKDTYNGLYGYGKQNIKTVSLEEQRQNLRPLFEPKPPAPKPKRVIEEPEPAPKPAPPAPKPAPKPKIVIEEPEPTPAEPNPVGPNIDIPDGTEEKVIEIINIYKSSDTDKKEKLAKYNKPQLTSAWEIIMKSVPGLQPKSVAGKTVDQLKQCLAGDQTEKCVKQTKKAKGGESSKYTRKKI